MSSLLAKRVPLWPAVLIAIVLMAVAVIVGAKMLSGTPLFGTEPEERNTQVINAITREEQVVLLSLGIQGIAEKSDQTTLLNQRVPWSERASFMQYSFTAKVGIDGDGVTVEQTGENEFLVSIPEFIFIGHDDEDFQLVAEDNGVLSWITPPIDPVEMINEILDDEAKSQYIESNRELLRDQAKSFYGGIISSVDSDVVVKYEFRG
jgi:hypothetical protein